MVDVIAFGTGKKSSILTNEAFENQIRSMIETKSLTALNVKKLLLDPEVKFVSINYNRCLDLPSVSIVLPLYNDETFVITCLETLVRQTYQNIIELIIIDDGSEDRSLKLVKGFENNRLQIHIIESKHHGRSNTKNIGIQAAKGEIVFFAESDAMYAPWYLEIGIGPIITQNADAVMLQGSWLLNKSIISKSILAIDQIKWGQISAGRKTIESAWIYKTETVRKVEGFDETLNYGEDKELLRRTSTINGKIGFCTGYNWFHPTQDSLKQYLQRRYEEQRYKVVDHRNRQGSSFLPFLVIILIGLGLLAGLRLVLGSILYLLPYALFVSFILFYCVRFSHLLKEQKNISYKLYLLILPLISVLSIFPRFFGLILRKARTNY